MIVFNINNTQEDYAKCYSVISYLNDENKEFSFDNPLEIGIFNDYSNYNQVGLFSVKQIERTWQCIARKKIFNCDDNFIIRILNSNDNYFYFRVKNSNESDCVNLSYIELLLEQLENYYLGIIPIDDSDIYRISSFYSSLNKTINKDFYNRRFFINPNLNSDENSSQVRRFNLKGLNTSSYYFPLLKINANTYKALNRTAMNFLTKEALPNTYESDEECIKEFCFKIYNKLSNEVKSYLYELKDKIEQTSYLSLSYLLSFLIYTEKESISKNKIISLLVDSEDFAEGTLQLIENAYLHAKNGYFCFRIHKKEDKEQYFNEYYYGEPNKEENNKYSKYIEILISDFNVNNDIPGKFKDNLNKNEKVSEELKNRFSDLKLEDIFNYYGDKKEQWREYYDIPENMALHYGLLSFEQIVHRAGGYFSLVSSTEVFVGNNNFYYKSPENGSNMKNVKKVHIPGSQYRILFPIKYENENLATGLKANLSLKDESVNNISIANIDAKSIMKKIIMETDSNNFNKNDFIKRYSKELNNKINNSVDKNDNSVLCINAKGITKANESEVLTKSLILLISNPDFGFNKIGLINVSYTFFSVFIRQFGILYYKSEHCKVMKDRQIFLCDEQCQTEIEFYGEKISSAVSISNYLSNSKGEYPVELSILEHISSKCINEYNGTDGGTIEAFPFDVVLPNENNTLFEKKVYLDLNRDIQDYPFGCKLSNVHMQVGSKIHIKDYFYEATLLFEISNYVSRFAYILAKKISKTCKENSIAKKRHIVLIGYETYSEMLMVHIKRTLERHFNFKNISYVIYDGQNNISPFRHWSDGLDDGYYVTIVPIGSTLTTHTKIEADIKRKNKNAQNFLMNLCVILIRNSKKGNEINGVRKVEQSFWESIDVEKKIVKMKEKYKLESKNEVYYVSCVENDWSEQKKCGLCFPNEDNLIEEKPILKVNKASVVPMTMIGLNVPKNLKKEDNKENRESDKYNIENESNIENLKQALMYGHYRRGDNHYEYYFRNDLLFDTIIKNDKRKFDSWIRKNIRKQNDFKKDRIVYDFLVAPLHKTNAAFVEYVNEKAFGMAKMVLWIDVRREYRDNIKTKYSNLTQLISNLVEANKKAEINFHYIDDTITTGYSYERIKNLISSLYESENENIKINLFASVILLLNRCSNDTKKKYINDTKKFHSYVNLNISAMRHHEDACSQCTSYNDYCNLASIASSNLLVKQFENLKKAREIKPIKGENDIKTCSDKEYFRMFFTHQINTRMGILDYKKNNKDEVFNLIINLIRENFNNSQVDKIEKICIILEIISSPFVEYRYSVQLAAFDILLKFAHSLLFEVSEEGISNFTEIIKSECSKEQLSIFIKTVFNQLSHMGANFVLRSSVIIKFMEFITECDFDDEESWISFYGQVIKQSLYFNKQGSRCIKLDEIIRNIHGCLDVISGNKCGDVNKVSSRIEKLMWLIFIENNIIINDTLNTIVRELNYSGIFLNKELLEANQEDSAAINVNTTTQAVLELINQADKCKIQRTLENIMHNYYCNDFVAFNNIDSEDDSNDNETFNIVKPLVLCKMLLIPTENTLSSKDSKGYYSQLLKQLSKVLGVMEKDQFGIQLFISINRGNDNFYEKPLLIGSSKDNICEGNEEFVSFVEEINANNASIFSVGDTYYCKDCNSYKTNVIKIANSSNAEDNDSNVSWYFAYNTDKVAFYNSLKNARNFLVLREALQMRLKRDFDNNLFEEYNKLKQQVSKLSTPKIGSHTSFPEIKELFNDIWNITYSRENNKDNNTLNHLKANSLHLLSDGLISKLYVYKITETYPELLNINAGFLSVKIEDCFDFLSLANDMSAEIYQGIAHPNICWHNINKSSLIIDYPDRHDFLWFCSFFSIILNSLRHGKEKLVDNKYIVDIDVKQENINNIDFIIVTNDYEKSNNRNNNSNEGITLKSLSYFFDNYYGENLFKYGEDKNKYRVQIPCGRGKDE